MTVRASIAQKYGARARKCERERERERENSLVKAGESGYGRAGIISARCSILGFQPKGLSFPYSFNLVIDEAGSDRQARPLQAFTSYVIAVWWMPGAMPRPSPLQEDRMG